MLTGGYNWRAFKNMGSQEAMDGAQVARNLSQGKGFTTLFIRPFSLYLVKRRNLASQGAAATQSSARWQMSALCPWSLPSIACARQRW